MESRRSFHDPGRPNHHSQHRRLHPIRPTTPAEIVPPPYRRQPSRRTTDEPTGQPDLLHQVPVCNVERPNGRRHTNHASKHGASFRPPKRLGTRPILQLTRSPRRRRNHRRCRSHHRPHPLSPPRPRRHRRRRSLRERSTSKPTMRRPHPLLESRFRRRRPPRRGSHRRMHRIHRHN